MFLRGVNYGLSRDINLTSCDNEHGRKKHKNSRKQLGFVLMACDVLSWAQVAAPTGDEGTISHLRPLNHTHTQRPRGPASHAAMDTKTTLLCGHTEECGHTYVTRTEVISRRGHPTLRASLPATTVYIGQRSAYRFVE